MKNFKPIFKTLLASFVISFLLLCAFPLVVFFALVRTNNSKAIEQFVAVLTLGSNRQPQALKDGCTYS
ncbi:MAG: hypothetical protein JSV88_10760 [Candidatus Aminicenantes bacterium]|nr:MAG: hypothetical protein JSV88_10760 [Candidatus Aminicenantes bacterium]